jgi:DNA polymerase-3 subunit chi
LPLIARATLKAGQRLLVVSADEDQLRRISEGMWTRLRETFLANGRAGGEHDARQPVLLSDRVEAANGARFVAMADGQWCDEAFGFDRAFLLFDDATVQGARQCWRMLGQREDVERHFWKQEDGKWVEGP